MLNQIILIGRLTDDPELNFTSGDTAVANFNLAVERNSGSQEKSQNSQEDVDFIPIVAWDRKAEICAEYLEKGRMIAVVGSLQLRRNQKDNITYLNPQVKLHYVQFLDSISREDPKDDEAASDDNNNSEISEPEKESEIGDEEFLDDIEVPF